MMIAGVRIFPMSDRAPGFVGKGIERVQRETFLEGMAAHDGRFRYRSSGLDARAGTVVLFQYKARVIASAVFLRDEKLARRGAGAKAKTGFAGVLYFDVASIRTFEPVDVAGMRKAWPGFRAFGHVKQFLNAAGYAGFRRRLRGVRGVGDGVALRGKTNPRRDRTAR